MLLKENTGIEAAIHQASAEARADIHRLDSRTLRELSLLYEDAQLQIEDDMLVYTNAQGNLTVQILQELLARVGATLAELNGACQELLLSGLLSAAEIGADLWYVAELRIASRQLAENAVRYVQSCTFTEGLRLADYLARLEQHNHRLVTDTLRQQIVTGDWASQTVQALLQQGKPAPADLVTQTLLQQTETVARAIGTVLLTGQDSPYRRMLRLLRTEINRAHVAAYRAAMTNYQGVVGERLIVSPHDSRKRLDDIHSQVNLYGLGAGVYPIGKAPWPEHPDALNFIEAVFADGVARGPVCPTHQASRWISP
jgi:hypothetical protein